jgi:TRAP-type C4-dicarboxylate transport system substrate-binding protein
MISRRNVLKTGTAALAGLALPYVAKTASAAKADYVMTFGHTFGDATKDYMATGLNFFKERAEKYAGGKLLVDIHEAGSLGGQTVLPQKVLTNAIQACQLSTQNFTPYASVYNLLDFPFLFPSNEKFEEILASDVFVDSDLIKEPESKGFKVLPGMWSNAGHRVIGVSKVADKVIKMPDDLDGIKIRVTGSKVEQQVFKLTPANPVSIAWGETYQALQQGAADALNVGLGPLTATKIYETLGSATMSQISLNCHITVLNKKWFDKLPSDVQGAIIKAAAESFEYQKEKQRTANEKIVKLWESSGIKMHTLSDDEKKAWSAIAGHKLPVWDEFKNRYGKDLYERIAGMTS